MSHDDPDEKMFHDRAAALALLEGGQCIDGEDDDISVAGVSDAAPGDSLDRKTSLRANKWNELNRVAKFTRLQPPTVLQGIIGNQVTLIPSNTQRVVAPVANWGGETEETMPITVTFAPVNPNPVFFGVLASRRPVGIVQFGSKGALVDLEVDIGRGCQFTISASAVTLQVALDQSPTAPGTNPTYDERVSFLGTLSYLPVIRTVPITRTVYLDNALFPGDTITIFPPMFAKNIVLWEQALTVLPLQLSFLDSASVNLYQFTMSVPMLTPIPLSTDVAKIVIHNPGPAGSPPMRAIFQLSI